MRVDRVEILGQAVTDFESLSGSLTETEVSALVDVKPGGTWTFQNCRCVDELFCGRCIAAHPLIVDAPFPATADVEVYFEGKAKPLVETVNLETHDNTEAPLSYIGRADDLTYDELWSASSDHPGDKQVFALDLGIRAWDPEGEVWSHLYPGANKYEKESFRAYGKPVYAMAPGRICSATGDHSEPKLVGCGTCGTGLPPGRRARIGLRRTVAEAAGPLGPAASVFLRAVGRTPGTGTGR